MAVPNSIRQTLRLLSSFSVSFPSLSAVSVGNQVNSAKICLLLDVEDEESFVDEKFGLYLMAGYENVIYGSGIRTSHGTNGIMPGDRRLVFD